MLIIEGVSCTGKTALCKLLAERYGFFVADEGIRYLERSFGKSREEILRVPSSIDEERHNQDLLFDAESIKLHEAFAAAQRGRDVVLDKSALSIMASAYAFGKTKGMFGDIDYARRKMIGLIDEFGIAAFGEVKIALLDLDLDSRRNRRAKRNTALDDVWLDDEITSLQHSFLMELLSLKLVDGRVFFSDASDLERQVTEFYGA